VPGVIIDSYDNEMGVGQDLKDGFDKRKNCVDLRLNRPNTPDCIIGYANRDIMAGENICAELGKAYWCQRGRMLAILGRVRAVECKAFYKITDDDITD